MKSYRIVQINNIQTFYFSDRMYSESSSDSGETESVVELSPPDSFERLQLYLDDLESSDISPVSLEDEPKEAQPIAISRGRKRKHREVDLMDLRDLEEGPISSRTHFQNYLRTQREAAQLSIDSCRVGVF